ncbi:lytic transglycosylase domain-containing protein [Nitrosomonas sp. Nm33]|uniref:lytic transglycosylase domain-containing protein n=1 Tax=Nitrosomonas sp. Nm33 TaxID=133724 RepID=UPI0008966EA2|nr:transglycosylase SLT domain-containing protein [Nitrosomonas sp. Nm33]SDY75768.1 Transglycosylase SLT domain-containing protein [Nitrosomonas sp. Nm33]
MGKIANLSNSKPDNIKSKPKRKRSVIAHTNKGRVWKWLRRYQSSEFKRKLVLLSIEVLSLGVTVVLAIMVLLGYSANQFSGTSFFGSLLPFSIGVVALIVAASVFSIGWWKLRKRLQFHSELLPPILSFSFALLITWSVIYGQFTLAYGNFRTLIGGKEEAGRMAIAHQVYAAYRRHSSTQLQKMVNRSQEYRQAIKDAADAFDIDINLLLGIAATESSFISRDSSDGGRGLFQITQVPKTAVAQVLKRLNVEKISLENPRHNAFIAAATFKRYFAEMKGDLFLTLLAYNIGPANGGLRFIMQQYGASDFTTIQPYLQTLPRDYPIRVLSYSLAFRLWQTKGKLLAYEEGNNAIYIQRIGIPGLHTGL